MLLACALAWPVAAGADAELRLGSEGPRVGALQRAFGVRVDGVFGASLRVAVMRLQRSNGLTADGAVGPATWGLLERIHARARRHAERPAPAAAAPARARPAPRRAREAAPVHVVASPRRLTAALGGGWAGALETTLRGSSSLAIGARVQRARRPLRLKLAEQGPSLRMGMRPVGLVRHRLRPLLPLVVRRVIAAGDRIATMPYHYGGGHGSFDDSGYDCSGSVSYALHGGGLLDVAMASGGFMGWGAPGPGRWITIYASPGHAFMVVAGRRFDTSGRGQTGSRWQADTRGAGAGYVVRHPPGL